MRSEIKDVIDRHKGQACVVTLHGPSLNLHKEQINEAQSCKKILRFSVNNWFDYFEDPPDYWILSSSEEGFPIRSLFPIVRQHKTSIFYSDDGDFTSKDSIEREIQSEWLAYDQRHWEGKTCIDILKQFKEHHLSTGDFNFKNFGNNPIMWQPPRCYTFSGHSLAGRCCLQNSPPRTPIQEELQALCGHEQHYSTGDTVAMHAIAFAIIMGCNPIYVSGLDLDYNKGYANAKMKDWAMKAAGPNAWAPIRENLENDLRILYESAAKRNITIYTLNPEPWYGALEKADRIDL